MEHDKQMTECPGCEGTGLIECDYCAQETDCPTCDGTGEVEEGTIDNA